MGAQIGIGFGVLVVVMLTIPLLLAWSSSRRRPRVGRTDGQVVLRMPRGHNLVMGVLAFLPFALLSGMSFAVTWAPGAERGGLVLGVLLAVVGLAGGTYFLLQELRGCIRLDDAGLTRVSAFGTRRVAWGEVARIDFNHVNHWFYMTLRGGGRVYVVEGLDGMRDFAEVALAHLPPSALEPSPLALEALQELANSP
jgi:hypothetical protein